MALKLQPLSLTDFLKQEKSINMTKKNYLKSLLIIALILVGINAKAGDKAKLALVATPQLSWLNTDSKSIDDGALMLGFNFGVHSDIFFAPNYAFTTGLTISNLGGKLTYNDEITFNNESFLAGQKIKFKLSYIEIPLGLKLKTNEFRRSIFFGQFGLNPMVNIKAEDGNNNNISDEINLINVAYNIGAGIEYSLGGNTALIAGIIYKNGFLDVTKDHNSLGEKTTLNIINFNLGILF